MSLRSLRALILCIGLAAVAMGACSSDGGDDDSASSVTTVTRVDSTGNPIEPGDDWSGAGAAGDPQATTTSPDAEDGAGGSGGDEVAAAGQDEVVCEVPTTTPEQGGFAPPPEEPFGPESDDFTLEVSIEPDRADAGSRVVVEVHAIGRPQALAVMLARFSDGTHHGMRAATFTDATGRASFEGPIPETAPDGLATISVSVSEADNTSATEQAFLTVTGPRCP